jgi:hypothetical protein
VTERAGGRIWTEDAGGRCAFHVDMPVEGPHVGDR